MEELGIKKGYLEAFILIGPGLGFKGAEGISKAAKLTRERRKGKGAVGRVRTRVVWSCLCQAFTKICAIMAGEKPSRRTMVCGYRSH